MAMETTRRGGEKREPAGMAAGLKARKNKARKASQGFVAAIARLSQPSEKALALRAKRRARAEAMGLAQGDGSVPEAKETKKDKPPKGARS